MAVESEYGTLIFPMQLIGTTAFRYLMKAAQQLLRMSMHPPNSLDMRPIAGLLKIFLALPM